RRRHVRVDEFGTGLIDDGHGAIDRTELLEGGHALVARVSEDVACHRGLGLCHVVEARDPLTYHANTDRATTHNLNAMATASTTTYAQLGITGRRLGISARGGWRIRIPETRVTEDGQRPSQKESHHQRAGN